MNFLKVEVLSDKDVQEVGEENDVILLNVEHIVSIKPINMFNNGLVLQGYWIRMSNGKKYRAIELPQEFLDLF